MLLLLLFLLGGSWLWIQPYYRPVWHVFKIFFTSLLEFLLYLCSVLSLLNYLVLLCYWCWFSQVFHTSVAFRLVCRFIFLLWILIPCYTLFLHSLCCYLCIRENNYFFHVHRLPWTEDFHQIGWPELKSLLCTYIFSGLVWVNYYSEGFAAFLSFRNSKSLLRDLSDLLRLSGSRRLLQSFLVLFVVIPGT